MTGQEVLEFAFAQNYHADKSNAAIHHSKVRFSPLTFRIAECLYNEMGELPEGVTEVLNHKGTYPEDRGRIENG